MGRVRAKDVSDDWERELQYNPSILDTRVVLAAVPACCLQEYTVQLCLTLCAAGPCRTVLFRMAPQESSWKTALDTEVHLHYPSLLIAVLFAVADSSSVDDRHALTL